MTLTPELIAQLSATFGPVGAMAVIVYLTRAKKADTPENPVKEVISELSGIKERIARIEGKLGIGE